MGIWSSFRSRRTTIRAEALVARDAAIYPGVLWTEACGRPARARAAAPRRYGASGLLWSVGRVQTPVLALIVRRDDEIRTFVKEPFWELMTRYRDVVFKYHGDRFLESHAAQAMLEQVQGHPFAVTKVDRKEERSQPPQLFDLTELQRAMNRRFGSSADATLKTAQSLYEAKLITYPRTDSRYVGRDMQTQIPGILRQLQPTDPRKSTSWISTRYHSPGASSTIARSPTTTRSFRWASCPRRPCRHTNSRSLTRW